MRTWILVVLLTWVLAGCASKPDEIIYQYKLYPGPSKSLNQIAIVKLGNEESILFDGLSASARDWHEVHLLPGVYSIVWEIEFDEMSLTKPYGSGKCGTSERIDLRAGHVYELNSERVNGQDCRMSQWIVDLNTGQVILGKTKP